MYNRQIQTFVYASESGSFSKAAEKLYLTPASVMHQINALESRTGIKLLERTNLGVALTPAGRSIYKDAKRMIEEAGLAITRAKKIAGIEHHVMRVGTSLLNPCNPLIDLWEKIRNEITHFQMRIVPFTDDHANILSQIEALGEEFDLFVGACGSSQWLTRCNFYPLGSYHVCCAIPRKHRLAGKSRLTIEDLHAERLMLVKRGDSEGLDQLRDLLEKEHPQIQLVDRCV